MSQASERDIQHIDLANPPVRFGFNQRMSEVAVQRGSPVSENELRVLSDADNFFFDEKGFRQVHSYMDTWMMGSKLASLRLYGHYLQAARMCTLPTTEYLDEMAELISALNPQRPLEVGAGDGVLAHNLQVRGVRNLRAIDDQRYGGRRSQEINKEGSGQELKSTFPIVEPITLADALPTIKPDLVIASWLVNDNRGDDVSILLEPSVKYFILIGARGAYRSITTTESMWEQDGWSKVESTNLSGMHLNALDEWSFTEVSLFWSKTVEEYERTGERPPGRYYPLLSSTKGSVVVFCRK